MLQYKSCHVNVTIFFFFYFTHKNMPHVTNHIQHTGASGQDNRVCKSWNYSDNAYNANLQIRQLLHEYIISYHIIKTIFSQTPNFYCTFHVWVIPCQLIHFFADPSPILMKFGKLGGQQKKLIHTKFQHISTIFNGVRAL